MYIGDWIGRIATAFPDRLALVDAGRGEARFSYADLDRRARRLAGWLYGQGVRPGARVGVLAENGVEMLDLFYACGKLGAVFTPFNWRLHAEELSRLAAVTEPLLVLHDAASAELVARTAWSASARVTRLDAAADAPAEPALPSVDLSPDDTACLLFTGGTTGLPKAARITHGMIAWNILTTAIHELSRDDVTVTHAPLFHAGGLLAYTVPLLALGGSVVLMPRWDAGRLVDLAARHRATFLLAFPTQYAELVRRPELGAADLSRLRFATSGGAPLAPELVERWWQATGVVLKQGFGMTEFGPGVFSMRPEEARPKAGSIGRPNFFVDARLVDGDGRDVPRGTIGEIELRGPARSPGYLGAAPAAPGAWLRTGDLARVDEDGCYWLAGRSKDMFISGGENVFPLEVEGALGAHPAVAECAVVGVADAKWGEVGRAFVVLAPGAVAADDELAEFLRGRLARFKVPRSFVRVARLPRSAAGKLLRRELAQGDA